MECKNIFIAIMFVLVCGSIVCMEQTLSSVDRIFLNACKNNKSIDFALAQGANIFAIDPQNGFSALHYAYLNDNKKRIAFLISKGLDENLLDPQGFTPQDILTVRQNLKQLSEENISFNDFCSRITFLKNNYKDKYSYIINYPLSLDGNRLLHYIIINEKPIKWVTFLLDNGADVNIVSQMGTPLHILLCFRNIINYTAISHVYLDELVTLFIERGADLSIIGRCGYTILQSAIQFQPAWIRPILNKMIEKEIDISKADQMNHNALYEVITTYAEKDVLKILKLLFDKGCKPLIDIAGISLIHKAVERSYNGMGNALPIIEELLKRGVGVNDRDEHGQTPLHYAAEFANAEVVNTLLFAGALHPRMIDGNGKTPLDLSKKNSDKKVILLLQEADRVWWQLANIQRSASIAGKLKKDSLSVEMMLEQEQNGKKATKLESKQEQKKEKIKLSKKSKRKNNQKKKLVVVEQKIQEQSSMLQEVKNDKKKVTIEEKRSEEVIISDAPYKQKKSLLAKAQDLAVKVLTGNATDAAVTKTYAAALNMDSVQQQVIFEQKEEFKDDYVTVTASIKASPGRMLAAADNFNPLASTEINFYSENVLNKMADEKDHHHNFSYQVEERLGRYFTRVPMGGDRTQFVLHASLTYPSGKKVDGRFNYVVKKLRDGKTQLRHRHFEKEKQDKKMPLLLPSSLNASDK